MGLHVCQIMGYEQIQQSLDLITINSARALHILGDYGIAVGKPANLIVPAKTATPTRSGGRLRCGFRFAAAQ